MSFQGIVGEMKECYGEVKFEWKVLNFLNLVQDVNNRYHSPSFDFWGKSFYLQMYPNGEDRTKSKGWISLYLVLKDKCTLTEIKYQFAIKTTYGEIENINSGICSLGKKGKRFGVPKFLEKGTLLSRINEWVPLEVLTVTVTLELGIPHTEKGSEKVLKDLIKAWRNGDNSDVVVRVRDAEFPAHKFVLAARSQVLFAMFKHDTTESRSGEIKIDDCDPDVFREFLNYIYTGGPQELTSRNAASLYAVAEKYMADDLKAQCLSYIRCNLNVDTFCETVKLALNYEENELLKLATDFASENIRLIVKSVQWQQFIQDEPVTANEILIKAL